MMQINEDKLAEAASESPGTVKSALSGYGGLAEQTSSSTFQAMRIPAASYAGFESMGMQSGLLNMFMPRAGSLFDFLL